MKLEKQDIGVWVNINSEYPTKEGKYHVRWLMKDRIDIDTRYWNGTDVNKTNWKSNVHEWLKPIKDVYVFTQNEFENLVIKTYQHSTMGG